MRSSQRVPWCMRVKVAAWKILYTAPHCSPLHYCPDAHDGCALECRAVSLSSAHPFSWPGRAAFNLTVFSAVSRTHQDEAGPGPKGKPQLGTWLFWKKVAEFHFNSLSRVYPQCVCVCAFPLICLCCVVLSHSALTQIPSYLSAAESQLNKGKVKPADERANDTFSNMTLWTGGVSRLC